MKASGEGFDNERTGMSAPLIRSADGAACFLMLANKGDVSKDTAMQVTLSDELIQGLDLTPEHVKLDLAIGLYAERRVTLGRAAKLAGLLQPEFLRCLGNLRIPLHYDLPELNDDLQRVREAE